jgi:hypothetical protein
MTLHTFIILPLSFIALGLIFVKRKWSKEKWFIRLFILNFLLSAWYAFWFNNLWIPLKKAFQIAVTFNFARFHFLRPFIIYLLFALSCYILLEIGKGWRKVIKVLILFQIILLFLVNEEVVFRILGTPSFKEYYAVSQFNEIREYIGLPQSSYRIASIGLHPAVSQYNGFYTIDTYNNFYPLAYKYQFRKIIEKELDKNDRLKEYFDEWGSRCYLFVDELGKKYDYRKDSGKEIQNLEINIDAFKEMGGQFIFSAVPIQNAEENKIQLMKVFDNRISAWRIYLYKAM